ncbi:copper amine oxidase N-terminal domain-containing protein [Desulfuribacillus alkaliarsenatis]|uniref:Copper amine oxidase-like N-terminal domain-containing protein n=1 Tax=Desulfuribacillus alkaliarsenatis TaxID=766136 RepID=A0A1E5G1V8_9FIRM|nr:copper amine oxidase N-terminal domain-containing protein [Desulfuribacillus alkaliarsenatis]OEF96812.1 hypothetical protein BHF68_07055 [Desulfuribacillus alkaliarsenatis]
MRDQLNKGKHLSTPLRQKKRTFFQGGETINMKQRKLIASLLAFAMVLSLVIIPVGTADARSVNSVDRVPTVKDDYNFTSFIVGNDYSGVPTLAIENDDATSWPAVQEFRLTLPAGAKWGNQAKLDQMAAAMTLDGSTLNNMTGAALNTFDTLEVRALTDTVLTIRTNEVVASGDTLFIPLTAVELDGITGEVVLTVNARDSRLSNSSHTIAVSSSGNTIATVGKKETVTRGPGKVGQQILIDEALIGAVRNTVEQGFSMRLPAGFEWNDSMETTANFDFPAEWGTITGFDAEISSNKRVLSVSFNTEFASNTRQTMQVTPVFNVTRDAAYGNVVVDITNPKGDFTSQAGLVVAEYKTFGTTLSAKEAVELLAGKDYGTNSDYITAEITLEEVIADSILPGRVIEFELPSWVAVDATNDFRIVSSNAATAIVASDFEVITNNQGRNLNRFEISSDVFTPLASGDKAKLVFEIPLAIDGRASGDVNLTVRGAGVEEQTVKVATVTPPAVTTIDVADIRLGIQDQAAPNIVIEEPYAGAWEAGKTVQIALSSSAADYFTFTGHRASVTEGDLEIRGVSRNNNVLSFTVDVESSVASTVTLSGIEITVNRNAPEGYFTVDVQGTALVEYTGSYSNSIASRVDRVNYANVVTRAPDYLIPGQGEQQVVFSVDSSTYTVGGVERVMDVAPFIQDGRTMLPVRFVADSVAVSEDNIIWNPVTKQVTLMKGDRIAQMTIGSNVMLVNGVSVAMDTTAEIKDGRTVLPVRFVAQALGVSIQWDDATRTVTIN